MLRRSADSRVVLVVTLQDSAGCSSGIVTTQDSDRSERPSLPLRITSDLKQIGVWQEISII